MKRLFQAVSMCCAMLALAVGGVMAQDDGNETRDRILVSKAPDYWIGVHAIPIQDALKAHLQLQDRLIVARVVPDSPADKAGLQQHDIVLKFGDAKVTSLEELIAAVEAAEANETSVVILRGGEETTVAITPTKRPDTVMMLPVDRPLEWKALGDWWGTSDGRRRTRVFGPGVFLDSDVDELPDGISIQIQKKNDKPAEISVKRGDESWKVTEEELEELPEDLRDHVKSHLKRRGERSFFRIDGNADGGFRLHRFVPDDVPQGLNQAIRRLEQLHHRFEKDDPFKEMQDQIESLRREVEKLRNDEPQEEVKPAETLDA